MATGGTVLVATGGTVAFISDDEQHRPLEPGTTNVVWSQVTTMQQSKLRVRVAVARSAVTGGSHGVVVVQTRSDVMVGESVSNVTFRAHWVNREHVLSDISFAGVEM